MAAALKEGSTVDGPAAPGPDPLLLAFMRLCRQLDRPLSEIDLKAAGHMPQDGTDLADLARLAERLGFALRSKYLTRRTLARLTPPFLVIGRDPGKVWLVRARSGNQLTLVEPLHGGSTPCTLEGMAALGARILRLVPAEPGAGSIWSSHTLRRLRGMLWQIGLASVVINLLALATPLFMMAVYNKVINHAALQTLDALAIGMVTLVGFELVLRALRGYIAAHAGARLDAAIGSDVVHHIVHLPYRTFESVPSGQMLERLRQLDQLRQFLTGQLPLLIVDLAFVGLFVAALFFLTPTLALITLLAVPAFVLLSLLAQRSQRTLHQAHAQAANAKAAAFGEVVAQALTVKSLALEPDMERRFERPLVTSAWTGLQAGRVGHLAGSLGVALQHLTALALVYVGARMIVAGELSIGALIAASILSARALAPLRQIAFAWSQLRQARDAVRRLDKLMAEANETQGRRAGAELRIAGHLQLEEVSFRYPGAKQPALDRVSLDIAPGTTIGVVGAPGSGKTTLVKLLLGLETPQQGRVLLDGHDLKQLLPLAYRGQIGVVPQEVQLFSGTIAENIGLGAADRSFARVVAAARFVGADEFIRRLPDGYDTRLGERGAGLSLGQRQLIALARAIVRNPRILILDEATSALDAAAETYLLANIKRTGRGRTVIFVTHRPSVLEICSLAVLLDGGRIARMGAPGEIMALIQPPARPGLRAVT